MSTPDDDKPAAEPLTPQEEVRGSRTIVTDKRAWAQYMRERRAEWKRRRLAAAEAPVPSGRSPKDGGDDGLG